MSRYIDADELKKELKWEVMFDYDADYRYVTEYDIDNTPTADVAEIKQGRWVSIGNTKLAACKCGFFTDRYSTYNFCPNCGAKMDGKEEENATD